MKHPQLFNLPDAVGVGSLITITGVLYTAGGELPAAFGLAATVAWFLGPPVFAFALGQAGLAISSLSASLLTVAAGWLAVAVLLISDAEIPSPVTNWSVAMLFAVILATAVGLTLQRSLVMAAIVSIGGIGVFSYAVTMYGQTGTTQTRE